MFLLRRTLITAAFVGTAVLPCAAFAQDADAAGPRAYVGMSVEAIELNSFDGASFNLFGESTTTVAVRGGVILNKYFAVEGEAAFGVDNADDDGIADYNNRFAGYGRARLPFGNTGFEIFARAGYAVTSIESRNVVGGDGSSLDGITYGGGLAFNFGNQDQFQVRAEYTEFNFGNDQDADAISFGVGYNF